MSNKVRTTLTLDRTVIKRAKELDINISAAAERGIIDYIKEMENLRRENTNSDGKNRANNSSNSRQSSGSNLKRRGGDSNSCSPYGEPAFKAGALGQTLLPRHIYN